MSQSFDSTKTAVALPHCSESTEESVAGWCIFGSAVWLEFMAELRNAVREKYRGIIECFQSGICSKNRRNTIFFCGRCNTHDFETFFFSFVEHYRPGDYMLCPRVFLPFLTSSRYTAVGMTPVFFCTYFSRYRTAVLIDSRIIRCYTGVQQYLPGWGE